MICSGILTLAWSIISFLFYRLFTAPYFAGFYNLDRYFAEYENNGVIATIKMILQYLVGGIFYTFTIYGGKWLLVGGIFIISCGVASCCYWICNRGIGSYIPLFVLLSYVVGTIVLYSWAAQAIRTITPAALFSIVFICAQSGEQVKNRGIILIGTVFFLLGLSLQFQGEYFQRNWADEGCNSSQLQMYTSIMSVDNKSENPWDNTVGILLEAPVSADIETALPAGLGVNYYLDFKERAPETKYILIDARYERLETLEKYGYCNVASGFGSYIYVKK